MQFSIWYIRPQQNHKSYKNSLWNGTLLAVLNVNQVLYIGDSNSVYNNIAINANTLIEANIRLSTAMYVTETTG